jgi:ABC-type multidrug transport system permease subunit
MFLGLGFTIAGKARTMDTVPMLVNLVVFPMMFLGNVFFSSTNMPAWLQPIAGNLPLAHFAQALRQVMTEGAGLRQIQVPLLALTAWTVGLVTLSIFTFRLQEREG